VGWRKASKLRITEIKATSRYQPNDFSRSHAGLETKAHALPVRGCSMGEIIKALPDIEQAKVTNTVLSLAREGRAADPSRASGGISLQHRFRRNTAD
jgi:hypothetical protein